MNRAVVWILIGGLGVLTACPPDKDASALDNPTYYEDIKPIVDAHCGECHVSEGIGPFPLTTYDEVVAVASLAEHVVFNRTMPPWGAEDGHQTYRFDPSLSDDQVDLLTEWLAGDRREGDPALEAAPITLEVGGLSRVDLELTMPEAYVPERFPDDYRCFVLDWPETEDVYVTGFRGLPGDASIVHHVVGFLVSPEQAAIAQAYQDVREGIGYPCFGGATPDDFDPATESRVFIGFVGQWAPGMKGTDFPADTGILVRPGSKIVLQVHYNAAAGGQGDQTRIQLKTDPSVANPAHYVAWQGDGWTDDGGMHIPAGQGDVHHGFSSELSSSWTLRAQTAGQEFPEGVLVHALFPHMHRLGREVRLTARRGGEPEILLRVPQWDFNWQREYHLAVPAQLAPGDELGLDCWWDNTADYRAQNDVTPVEPVDVYWGEGTLDEMCVSMLYVTAR